MHQGEISFEKPHSKLISIEDASVKTGKKKKKREMSSKILSTKDLQKREQGKEGEHVSPLIYT